MNKHFSQLSLIILMLSSNFGCAPAEREAVDQTIRAATAPVPFFTRHHMTPAEYQTEISARTAAGWRPTHISGYNNVEGQFFAAMWEQRPSVAWVARHGMTSAQYQAEITYWNSQGYRPTILDGYDIGSSDYYAAVFEQVPNSPAWVARHGLTSAQYQAEMVHWKSLGYRPKWVQGYGVQNVDRYIAYWELTGGPAWAARHGLNTAQFEAEHQHWLGLGYRLTHISGYQISGTNYWAALWEQSSGPKQILKLGLTAEEYQHQLTDLSFQGYRLKQVDGYPADGYILYAAIFELQPGALNGDYCQNNLCFDLGRFADRLQGKLNGNVVKYAFELRRGTSVISRASGPKRTAMDPPAATMTVSDRFNPASVSKMLTAVATLKILADHAIDVDTPVWSYLPPHWTIPANNRTITFAELMNHTSGLRESNGGGLDYPAIQTLMAHSIAMNDKYYLYDNANAAVLRILIASIDGFTTWNHHAPTHSANRFVQYVGDHVTEPLGIYGLQYRPDLVSPTLFYPFPSGTAHGTSYGDWTTIAGPAGAHLNVHELALFGTALFNGTLVDSAQLAEMKSRRFAVFEIGTLPDGSRCWGHGGYFPASHNGGSELSSALIHCDNEVTGVVLLNGTLNSAALFMDAQREAFAAQSTRGSESGPIIENEE